MYKRVSVLAFSLVAAACTTPQTATAEKQICTNEPVEATGTRVETETVCRPAE